LVVGMARARRRAARTLLYFVIAGVDAMGFTPFDPSDRLATWKQS
jgi:hypothetical protein